VEVRQSGSLVAKLRCAYTYGAPLASYEDKYYRFKGIYDDWNSKIGHDVRCYVRKGGVVGESQCAIALNNPAHMQDDAGTSGPMHPKVWGLVFYGSSISIGFFCMCIPAFFCLSCHISKEAQYQPADEESVSSSSAGWLTEGSATGSGGL